MARPRKTVSDPCTVVAYLRVSTAEQADSGLGLAAQRTAVEAECARRGWRIIAVHEDAGISGKKLAGRPGLAAALTAVETGAAGGIVVSKLDRLSRSLVDFAAVMERAQAGGWNLVALDLGVDLSTPAGEFLASVMASAAAWERRIIGVRTKDALAAKKASGTRLGREPVIPPAVAKRIRAEHAKFRAEHAKGAGWSAIAKHLNDEGVPTAGGGARWWPSTVRAVVLAER